MSNQYAGDEHLRPPYAQGNHQLGPSSSPAACLTACCCRCRCVCILFFLSFPVFIFLLHFLPWMPQFDLQDVDVESLLIAHNEIGGAGGTASPSAAYLSLNITLRFASVNPNNEKIRYEASNISVLYHGVPLGMAAVQGFELLAGRTRLVDCRVSVSRFNMSQIDSAELVREASVNDNVELRVTAGVGWKIRTLGVAYHTVQVPVDCVVVLSPRNQSLAYKKCNDERVF